MTYVCVILKNMWFFQCRCKVLKLKEFNIKKLRSILTSCWFHILRHIFYLDIKSKNTHCQVNENIAPHSRENVSNIMGNKLLFMCSNDVTVNYSQKLLKYPWKISATIIHARECFDENKSLYSLAVTYMNLLNYHTYRCSDPNIIYIVP